MRTSVSQFESGLTDACLRHFHSRLLSEYHSVITLNRYRLCLSQQKDCYDDKKLEAAKVLVRKLSDDLSIQAGLCRLLINLVISNCYSNTVLSLSRRIPRTLATGKNYQPCQVKTVCVRACYFAFLFARNTPAILTKRVG